MRKVLIILSVSGLMSAPAMADGKEKSTQSKAEREAAEEREQARKCKLKRESDKAKCRPNVPIRGETPSAGPIDRAYNAPFF
ncbi:MAG: hypothetical protein HKO13_03910 [Sphingomonas sp.]|nr:hypothetical protein [Sphingomonas sp.]RZV50851.1 MAG: hypothetical protein EX258_04750 [Sphingomonadaceae bacterium]